MLNLMKADMYRIVRGKGLYIIFGLAALFIALTVFVFRSVAIVLGVANVDPMDFERAAYLTGADASLLALGNVSNSMYLFLIVPFIVVAMAGFSSGAVKNELSAGIGRGKLYGAKWMLSVLVGLVFLIFNMVLTVVLALLVDGLGDWGYGHLANVLQSFGLQVLVMSALMSVGIFIAFVTRKTAATLGIFLAFVFVPGALASILAMAFDWAARYAYYDLTAQFAFFANVAMIDRLQIVRGVVLAVGFIVVPTVAGLAIFRRAEIK